MIVLILFFIPLLAGFVSFFIQNGGAARLWALLSSLATLAVAIIAVKTKVGADALEFSAPWMSLLGSSFSLRLDGMSQLLCLLNAVAYPLIIAATWHTNYFKVNRLLALLLFTQAGMMGVFTAVDGLLFYFFWELALIPMYFLCSLWGGERRIQVTFKFFIYTFTGSVLMLVALLYVYSQTPDNSFALESLYNARLSNNAQTWVFWALFAAFAVKMPVWPFHTWQPDTYEQSPTAATMVLSGVMVKMGLFGVVRWLLPIVPRASYEQGDHVMSLAVIGILYASVLAIQQKDLKRLIAYSSIAHVGLMVMAIFAETHSGIQGMMMQLFNHGINIIGLWIVVALIERQFGTRNLDQLGGIAQKAPGLTGLLVVVALANVSLPLTNAFVGEFLMFNGIFSSTGTKYNVVFTVLALISIILSAVYTLNMIQKVFFGATSNITQNAHDIRINERLVLGLIVVMILVFGVYPQPLLNLTENFTNELLPQLSISNSR